MQTQVYPQQWISLAKETRLHLIHVFNLIRTGISEIRDQELVSDGFTVDDLKAITHEKMNEYIGSVETFARAWEVTLAKVHAELNPPIAAIQNIDGDATAVDLYPVGIAGTFDLKDVVDDSTTVAYVDTDNIENTTFESLKPTESITFSPEPVKVPWCNSCDSKGVRHKLGCPHYTPTK